MRIAVTGGAGKVGSRIVEELRGAGHRVTSLDIAGPRQDGLALRVDFTDYGPTIDALFGVDELVGERADVSRSPFDAVVHLAAVPAPAIRSDVSTFHNNIGSTFNVVHAAMRAGIRRIVIASSETVLGLPFAIPPAFLPIDEEAESRPESIYGLVKHLEEQMAMQFARWYPEVRITALRLSNVIVDPAEYRAFAAFQEDETRRRWNLWSYIDVRDAARAVLGAIGREGAPYARYLIAAADTVMERPSADLVARHFPGVELRTPLGEHETLQSIALARRELGFDPQHSWRDEVGE